MIESVLVATESIITFRRRHSVRAGVGSVLELVLLDRDNPRSVAYQVDRLQEDLSAVSVADGSGVDAIRDGLDLVTARVRHCDALSLALVDESGFRPELDRLLAEVGSALESLALIVESTHFAPAAAPQPYSLAGAVAW